MRRILRITLPALLWIVGLPVWGGDIHQAADRGDLETVRQLLAQDASLLTTGNEQGLLPLHLAAAKGQLEVVRLLVKLGAPINQAENYYHLSPLHLAARSGDLETVRFLLERGADPQAREKDNDTAMYYAAISGSVEIAKLLEEKGLKVDDRLSRADETPLSIAIGREHLPLSLYFIGQGADVNFTEPNHWTLLHTAGWRGKPELLRLLIAKGIPADVRSDFGRTPLHNACMQGNLEGAALLIQAGADVNFQGQEGWTPLYQAVKRGHPELAALLLKAGARPDTVASADRLTPLQIAAIKGRGAVAALLLKAGARIDLRDERGLTALDYALRYGQPAIAAALRAQGAKPSAGIPPPRPTGKRLAKKLPPGQAIVWYLYHSGWAIRTKNHFLIFDASHDLKVADEPSLACGLIDPAELRGLTVTVFSSHAHADHFLPEIFTWKKELPQITYVLGFKPQEAPAGITLMGPREHREIGGLDVTTIEANDSGIGFVVKADGITLLHMGDHANRKQDFSAPFTAEIDWLAQAGVQPDLLFAPVSGCGFGDPLAVAMGAAYTIDKLKPRVVFPMHAGDGGANYHKFAKGAAEKGITVPILCADHSGDWFVTGPAGAKAAYQVQECSQEKACRKNKPCDKEKKGPAGDCSAGKSE